VGREKPRNTPAPVGERLVLGGERLSLEARIKVTEDSVPRR